MTKKDYFAIFTIVAVLVVIVFAFVFKLTKYRIDTSNQVALQSVSVIADTIKPTATTTQPIDLAMCDKNTMDSCESCSWDSHDIQTCFNCTWKFQEGTSTLQVAH